MTTTPDKLRPETWKHTGEKARDGSPVLMNPGNGLPCLMPRPHWDCPHIPLSLPIYERKCKEQMENAAFDMLAALKVADKAIRLLQDIGNASSDAAVHDLVVNADGIMDDLPSIHAAIAKAEGRA